MKNFTFLLLVLMLLPIFGRSQFVSQRRIRELVVRESGLNINVDYILQGSNRFNTNGLEVMIEPIPPSSMDSISYKNTFLDGRHSYSYFEESKEMFFLKRKREKKEDFEYLVNGLKVLYDGDIINRKVYDNIYDEIFFDYDDSEENKKKNTANNRFNPYYSNGRYLSVIKCQINNPSNKAIYFENKFQIISKNNILTPLSTSRLTSFYSIINNPRLDNLFRLELGEGLIIPPMTTIVKYFSCLPIDYTAQNFEIAYNGNTPQKIIYTINSIVETLNEVYSFYELRLKPKLYGVPYYANNYFYLNGKGADVYILDGNLYINKKDIDKNIELIVYGLEREKLVYSINKELNLKQFLDFQKKKRKDLEVELIQIKELKR